VEYTLLFLTVLLTAVKNVLSKAGGGEFRGFSNIVRLHTVMSAAAVLTVFITGAHEGFRFTPVNCMTAALYAAAALISQICYVISVERGAVSVCTLFYSCGFVVPALFGMIRYGETISGIQWIGFAVLIISFALSAGKTERSPANARWLPFAVTAMSASGIVGVIQKMYRMSEHSGGQTAVLLLAFAFMLCILLPVGFLSGSKAINRRSGGKRLIFALIMGVCMGIANKLNLWLSGTLPAAVMFPCVNGGCIVMTSVLSAVFLKERIKRKQQAGIMLGLAAILLIAV
jgi:drug/metabolite transporter (DMT)-like permease